MGKWLHKKTSHTREPRGQPFPSRWPQGCSGQTRQHERHIWKTQNINNKKGPQKKHLLWTSVKSAQTNAQMNYLVLVQGHCFFAWVKLLGVIRFLHPLAMARNQHGRHGTTEMFHASVLLQTQYHNRKWKHKKILLFYVRSVKHDVQLVKHDLQDGCSALIYYLLESKTLTMLSTNTSCSKK